MEPTPNQGGLTDWDLHMGATAPSNPKPASSVPEEEYSSDSELDDPFLEFVEKCTGENGDCNTWAGFKYVLKDPYLSDTTEDYLEYLFKAMLEAMVYFLPKYNNADQKSSYSYYTWWMEQRFSWTKKIPKEIASAPRVVNLLKFFDVCAQIRDLNISSTKVRPDEKITCLVTGEEIVDEEYWRIFATNYTSEYGDRTHCLYFGVSKTPGEEYKTLVEVLYRVARAHLLFQQEFSLALQDYNINKYKKDAPDSEIAEVWLRKQPALEFIKRLMKVWIGDMNFLNEVFQIE